jgi:vacuolar-type H+-ATPase subunit F/Vma7
MTAVVFVGDATSAAGFRLAGVHAIVPPPGGERAALRTAREAAPLVLVSASVAARVPPAELSAALAALAPIVAVVPDLTGGAAPPDLAARLKAQLGLAG